MYPESETSASAPTRLENTCRMLRSADGLRDSRQVVDLVSFRQGLCHAHSADVQHDDFDALFHRRDDAADKTTPAPAEISNLVRLDVLPGLEIIKASRILLHPHDNVVLVADRSVRLI